MVQFEFTAEFRQWVKRARKHCVLCKAMALIVHRAGSVVEVDEETARAATLAGAGRAITNSSHGDAP